MARAMVTRLLYRVPEAAEALGLSPAKVNELIARGELPSFKIDGSRRVPADALKDWVDARNIPRVAGAGRD